MLNTVRFKDKLANLHLSIGTTRQRLVIKDVKLSWAWWHTLLIPALGGQSQVDFWVRGQPGLQNEFQNSQGYTENPVLEKKKKAKDKQTTTTTTIKTQRVVSDSVLSPRELSCIMEVVIFSLADFSASKKSWQWSAGDQPWFCTPSRRQSLGITGF